MTARIPEFRIVGVILVVVVLAFTSALKGDAVYDDHVQLLRNSTIRDTRNIPKVFKESVWQFSQETSGKSADIYYRPIFNVGLILNYRLFGLNLLGWHLFSLLLHLIATLLVYALSRQWELSRAGAGIAALIFGLHTLHVESIAWISALPDPLITVFILSSILLYERYYRNGADAWRSILPSVLLAMLAMFTKETALLLPAFLGISEWLCRSKKESISATIWRVCKRVSPFAGAALIYLLARYAVLGFISQNDPSSAGITTTAAFLTIPSIVLSYLRLLVFPFPLTFVYGYEYITSAADVRFWGALIGLTLVAMLAHRLVRSSRVAQRALFLLLLFFLPALNLKAFNHHESLVHDRYLYLPSVGFCLLTAMGATWLVARVRERQRRILVIAGSLACVPLFCLTWAQNRVWKNDVTLGEHAVRWQPTHVFALHHLGQAYAEHGRLPEAEQALRKVVDLQPESAGFRFDLGYVYAQGKRYDEAVRSYQEAITLGMTSPYAFFNLGVTYLDQGSLANAESAFRRAVELQPGFVEALYNIGWINERQKQFAFAEKTYQEAIKQKPSYAESYIGMARIYGAQGRYQEAVQQLETVLRYYPDNPAALFELGGLCLRTNTCREAVSVLERLTERYPEYPGGLTFLGLSYECAGDIERAKASYRQAIRLVPYVPNTKVARDHLEKLEAHRGP